MQVHFFCAINAFKYIQILVLWCSPLAPLPSSGLRSNAEGQDLTPNAAFFMYVTNCRYCSLISVFEMPCQGSQGAGGASVPWTASHHGPVRVPDEITGAGKCRIRNISDVAILVKP